MQEIPEELHIDVLRRLSIESCTVRFLCVCKSWPFSPTPLSSAGEPDRNPDSPSPVTMIHKYHDYVGGSVYSLHSNDTLEPLPLSGGKMAAELPSIPNRRTWGDWDNLIIAESCNGLLCISEQFQKFNINYDGRADLVLWNPATSETKLLPPTVCDLPFEGGAALVYGVGFGFDPETNDYKVVRQISGGGNRLFVEVYSLRDDRWRKSDAVDCPYIPHLGMHRWQVPECHRGKLYWWECSSSRSTLFLWFDFSREVFQKVKLRNPYRPWVVQDVSMLSNQKESLVAICSARRGGVWRREVWVLLKFWEAKSWTKLYTIPVVEFRGFLGVSRNYKFLFNHVDHDGEGGRLTCYDLETGKSRDDLEISADFPVEFQVVNYVSCQVSLSDIK